MTITNDEIRSYLAEQHGVTIDDVKNGNELKFAHAGEYYGEDSSWLIYGEAPNSKLECWWFAGYSSDIERDLRNFRNRPQ